MTVFKEAELLSYPNFLHMLDIHLTSIDESPSFARCPQVKQVSAGRRVSKRKNLAAQRTRKDVPMLSQQTLSSIVAEHPKEPIMFTIGFTRKSMREFSGLLRDSKITKLVDIRLRPVSQFSGFAKKEDLEFLLELMGVGYIHTTELAPTSALLDAYRVDGNWERYEKGFIELLRERKPDSLLRQLLSPGENVAFLCMEDSPEKCHRRLVSEYARSILPELRVIHLTSYGTFEAEPIASKRQGSIDNYPVRNETPLESSRNLQSGSATTE